jgi:RNA polymerase sigma factor (sigma-70 family)
MATDYFVGVIGNIAQGRNSDSDVDLQRLLEKDLLAAAKLGHNEAFESLVRPHSKSIFRAIYRITKNREDAEDALQDSLLKAFAHLKSFDHRSQFSTWLRRIAINSALTIVRKKRSALGRSGDFHEDFDLSTIPDRALTPEARVSQKERRAIVRNAILALPPAIRQAFELQKLHGLSVAETAHKLGLSLAAVRSRLFRAKASLRQYLILNSGAKQRTAFLLGRHF